MGECVEGGDRIKRVVGERHAGDVGVQHTRRGYGCLCAADLLGRDIDAGDVEVVGKSRKASAAAAAEIKQRGALGQALFQQGDVGGRDGVVDLVLRPCGKARSDAIV